MFFFLCFSLLQDTRHQPLPGQKEDLYILQELRNIKEPQLAYSMQLLRSIMAGHAIMQRSRLCTFSPDITAAIITGLRITQAIITAGITEIRDGITDTAAAGKNLNISKEERAVFTDCPLFCILLIINIK